MNRRGYTLVEILIATALMLVIMYAVTEAFGRIGESIVNARAGLEMAEEARGAASRLKEDLKGVTVKMLPPRSPGSNEGYFQITEGPQAGIPLDLDLGRASSPVVDTTVGDRNDRIMFTTESDGAPFVGRCFGAPGGAITSQAAEIAWFVRGRTLFRRVLLVAPNAPLAPSPSFYADNDISVHRDKKTDALVASTLRDLTMLENRFAHQVYNYDPSANPNWQPSYRYPLPSHPFFYRDFRNGPQGFVYPTPWASIAAGGKGLELPLLAECTSSTLAWNAGGPIPTRPTDVPYLLTPNTPGGPEFDAWRNPHPWKEVSPATGIMKAYYDPDTQPPDPRIRVNEEAILNNVLSFDVKVWDPGARIIAVQASGGTTLVQPGDPGYLTALQAIVAAGLSVGGSVPVGGVVYTFVSVGAYVDLGYAASVAPGISWFSGVGNVSPNFPVPGVYDTWSTHYEEQNGGTGVNGFDDNGDGVVDDPLEWQYPPPYWAPLRGIQIKIRVYEPSSREIREVTVVQEFVSK